MRTAHFDSLPDIVNERGMFIGILLTHGESDCIASALAAQNPDRNISDAEIDDAIKEFVKQRREL